MPPSRIATPREFFYGVVDADVTDFYANRLDLRAAYHACTSLLSLRDWIFEAHKNKPWSNKGTPQPPFASKRQLQTALEAMSPRFAIVTDIANASKHMILDPGKSRTYLWGSANTEVQSVGGGISGGPISSAPTVASRAALLLR